jgi:hypothetical protein
MRITLLTTLLIALSYAGMAESFGGKQGTTLFDLQERLFDTTSGPADRVALESQFIRQGILYQKNPMNYFNELLFNKMVFQDGARSLYDYKDDYYYRFQISNYFFEDSENFETLGDWALTDLPHSYLFKRISRKQKFIKKLWGLFGDEIVGLLKPHFKKGSNQLKYVDALLRTWSCISEQDGYKKKMNKIIERLDEDNPQPAEMINYMEPILCKNIEEEFVRTKSSETYKWQDVQWLHSFWVRRYKEANLDIAVEILTEVRGD